MVVNVSATNTYEGEMFEIVTDYEFDFSGGLGSYEDDEYYSYFCWFEDLESEIEIYINDVDEVLELDDVSSCEEYYELFKEYSDDEEIIVDGIPVFVDYESDQNCCYFIRFWSDNYYYNIDLEAADEESAQILYALFVDGFRITDSTSWYKSDDAGSDNDKTNKDDKDSKDDKATDEKKESDSNNTTIIIVAIVVAGIVVIAVVAIVVLGKKKKQ